ncbi:MAG: ClpXP protease specificity-enhancing factor [Formosimonas sp.]
MSSQKPYLIRALWQWCSDQGHTPQIAVKINERTRVPKGYDDDGQIVLDISMEATQGLDMSNDWISFQARFGEVAHQIDIPVGQVVAIFAAETGQGMGFEVEAAVDAPPEPEPPVPAAKASPLKLVK